MKKIYRILISLGASIAMMFLATVILVFLKIESPLILAFITVTAFTITYKLIPASQKELDKKNTFINELFDDNKILRERGPLLHGKRIGEWSIFDEQGRYIRTDIYEDGILVSSKIE